MHAAGRFEVFKQLPNMLLAGRSNHHTYRLKTTVAAVNYLHIRGVEVRRMAHNDLAYAGGKVFGSIADDF